MTTLTRSMLALLAAVLTAVSGVAAPSTRLTYVRSAGAEKCPDESVLRRAVEQRLGYDPFFPWADRTIVARIAADARNVHGTVELLDGKGILRGSRSLVAPAAQCAELVSGMALAISIAIDPASVDRVPGASDAAAADTASAEWSAARAAEAAAAPAVVADVPGRAPPLKGSQEKHGDAVVPDVGVGAMVSAGLTPGIAGGPALAAAIHLGPWAFVLEGKYLFSAAQSYNPGVVSSSLVEGALLGCYGFGIPYLCAGGSAGRLAISGSGLTQNHDDEAFVGRILGRLGAELPLGASWFLNGYADLGISLSQPTVTVDAAPVWPSPRVGGSLGVAVHRRFP